MTLGAFNSALGKGAQIGFKTPLSGWICLMHCIGQPASTDLLRAQTAYITPGSPWENGYCESFNGKFRDQWLNGELFYSLGEAKVLIEQWRIHFNTTRPHQGINMKPPAPATWLPKTKAEKALHLSLFPPIPTPQEVMQRLNLQWSQARLKTLTDFGSTFNAGQRNNRVSLCLAWRSENQGYLPWPAKRFIEGA